MIVITGASSGIGEACARAFAKQKGATLFLLARRLDRLESLARELREKHGAQIHIAELDVRDRAAVESWAREHAELLKSARVLVNNAGLAAGIDFMQDASLDDAEQMIDTNVKGLVFMTRVLLPTLIHNAKAGAHVVTIGSVAGRWAYPRGNVYCATKAAVSALTEGLRLDLNGTGVRVTEIKPGMAETEFSQVRLKDVEKARAVYAGMTPLKAEDIAEAVVWACAQPRHVNIQEIVMFPTDQAAVGVVTRR